MCGGGSPSLFLFVLCSNMGTLLWIFLVSGLSGTTALISQSTLQKDFLQSLKPQDLFYYFDTISSKSVPQFELVWVQCWRNESIRGLWRCSFDAQEESFELGQHRSEPPVSCPSTLEMVINSTVSVVKKRDDMCCQQLKSLRPPNTRTLLPVCQGKLQGLIQSGENRLYIRPMLQNHIDTLKDFTVDLPSGVPHLILTHTVPVRTRLKQPKSQFRLRRTALGSEVTHLELAVVVGQDVYNVHRQDTERYILTNLNIASELLRDVTLGANIRLHLVRMVILTEPESEIRISENITASLKSVCKWGQKVNPDADTDPLHADLLLYITRFDLVLPNGNKLVKGVTQLGGVCSTQWNCVIAEDTGFDLGITIGHEIGHSFGINHDGQDNTCSSSGFMMASDGGYNSVDLTWSQCSRAQLHSFFSAGKAECVKDVPVLGGTVQDWRPGLFYGVDDQCRIAFGSSATACSFTHDDMVTCRVLSCHINPRERSSCTRLLVPLLDGTECGINQWCFKGRCVSPSTLDTSMMVHGSWSSWSDFSPCSRTCGGGVTHRKRQCNNPRPAFGGTVCKGPDTEAELCNRQPCETTQVEFMAQQCSATDQQPLSVSVDSTVYTWIPTVSYSSGDSQCKLMCRSRDQDFMVSRGSQFIDGTRCESNKSTLPGSVSACLVGKCQLFGCDGVMHSGKVEDGCGVCGGNGSTCQIISGTYSGGEAREYITFLSLPMNASQVHVINKNSVFTHLAVLLNGKYVVSGDESPAMNITYPSPLEKSPIRYHLYLTPDHLPHSEELIISGPATDKILIQVYCKYGREYGDLTSPNISYQYYSSYSLPVAAKGRWSTVVSPCSVTCGTGIQKISQMCVDINTLDRLEDELCSTSSRSPDSLQPCFLPDCPSRWELGEFGPCSAPCGVGERGRSVTCFQRQGTVNVQLPESECTHDPKPPSTETCNLQLCPARWKVEVPGECSAVCGPGKSRRTVLCVRSHRGFDSEVDQSLCSEPKPSEHIPCVVDVCPVGWDTERDVQMTQADSLGVMPRFRMVPFYVWSPVIGQCSKTCGNGSQEVWFSCVDHQSHLKVPEFLCDRSNKPEPHNQLCSKSQCPMTSWGYIQGVCSVSCGVGVAKRILYCFQEGDGNRHVMVGKSACQAVPRPSELVECNTQACPARWQVGEQGECSVSCGMGVAVRRVLCVQYVGGVQRVMEENMCESAKKPLVTAPCYTQACSFQWDVNDWSECSVSCGYGIQSRTVSCMSPSSILPVSPFLCLHLPKPITIQACYLAQSPTPEPKGAHREQSETQGGERARKAPGVPAETTPASFQITNTKESFSRIVSTEPLMSSTMITPTEPSQTSLCGRLLLQDSGTIDLRNVTQRRCIFAIGRPLDEVIQVKIVSSSLNCQHKDNLALYDRLILMRLCEKTHGKTVRSRSNVLLVRQSRLTPGNGVLLFYHSVKNKKSQHGECDVQLFSPSGVIENPIKSSAASLSNTQSCRVFIDAPPAMKIQIRALSVFNKTDTNSTYILIRDVDALKTTVFRGNQLFLWSSSGSRAEVEFHGEYQQTKGTFRAAYSHISTSEMEVV